MDIFSITKQLAGCKKLFAKDKNDDEFRACKIMFNNIYTDPAAAAKDGCT